MRDLDHRGRVGKISSIYATKIAPVDDERDS